VDHGVLERFEEILLELEMRQLVLLEETHGELTKSVESEEGDVGVVVAANLIRERGKGSESKDDGEGKRKRKTRREEERTWLKCSPRICQMLDHSRRIRPML